MRSGTEFLNSFSFAALPQPRARERWTRIQQREPPLLFWFVGQCLWFGLRGRGCPSDLVLQRFLPLVTKLLDGLAGGAFPKLFRVFPLTRRRIQFYHDVWVVLFRYPVSNFP